MTNYILHSGALLILFYSLFYFILKKETALEFNRYFLLAALAMSLILPSISFDFVQLSESIVADNSIITEYQTSKDVDKFYTSSSQILNNEVYNWPQVLLIIYAALALLLTFRFVRNLSSLLVEILNNKSSQRYNNYCIILSDKAQGIHSFFNSIILSKQDIKNGAIDEELLLHEQVHLQQKHFIDIIIIELLQILFWFNPIILLYKKSIKDNHEFLADRFVAYRSNSIKAYSDKIIQYADGNMKFSLASGFSFSSVKSRLEMIKQITIKRNNKIKLLTSCVLGICLIILFSAFSIYSSKDRVTTLKAINTIQEINGAIDYHNGALNELEAYALNSKTNFDTHVLIAKLIQNFGHSTKPALDIARIASEAEHDCDLYNELSILLFLDYSISPEQYIELAQELSESKCKEDINELHQRIKTLKEKTQFSSIVEALKMENFN